MMAMVLLLVLLVACTGLLVPEKGMFVPAKGNLLAMVALTLSMAVPAEPIFSLVEAQRSRRKALVRVARRVLGRSPF